MKVCNKCNLEKDIVHFKPCKNNKKRKIAATPKLGAKNQLA
jgi:hypothetical protein